MANEVAKQESEIRYSIDGREIVLTPSIVRKYLVRGKGDLVTGQELMFFLGICRARQMDPFAGDCYLVKYGQDPAAIITSIDFVRARARGQADCQGWTCGVIVADKDGKTSDSSGLVLEGEKILGGWAERAPKGWLPPMRLEVNLSGYLKKTSTGQTTKFWSPENQPTMIAKVAEMQILRRIWPAALGKLCLTEEVGTGDFQGLTIEGEIPGGNGEQQEETQADKFEDLVARENFAPSEVDEFKAYIAAIAGHTKVSENAVKARAMTDFSKFVAMFRAWAQKRREKAEIESKTKKAEKAQAKAKQTAPVETAAQAPAQEGPFPDFQSASLASINTETGEVKDPTAVINCPEDGEPRAFGWCKDECPTFQDCRIK